MIHIEKILSSIGLYMEEHGAVAKTTDGISKVCQCNGKPIILDALNNFVSERGAAKVLFDINATKNNCTYLLLEQNISEVLSRKINSIVLNVLNLAYTPELYQQVESEKLKVLLLKLNQGDIIDLHKDSRDILNKWKKIMECLNSYKISYSLVSLDYKFDLVFINNREKIKEYIDNDKEQGVYACFTSYISIGFPLYSLLKKIKEKMLGMKFGTEEIRIFKLIFKYIFELIDKENAYDSLDESFTKKNLNVDKQSIHILDCKDKVESPSVCLIRAFISLATHLDSKLDSLKFLDKQLIENQKINLSLTSKDIQALKNENERLLGYRQDNSYNDALQEKRRNRMLSLEELNQKLNNSNKLNEKAVDVRQRKGNKNVRSKKYLSSASYSSFGGSLIAISQYKDMMILDPTSERFANLIPDEERKRHTYVLAGSGSGKTSLLESLLYADSRNLDQSVIIFDLMGKATRSVKKFVQDPSRLIIIDPYLHSSITPIINPFELNSKDELSIENRTKAIINAFDIALDLKDGWSVNMKAMLAPCISTLLRKGDSDIYELQKFMDMKSNADLIKLGGNSPIKGHRSFFLNEFQKESFDVTRNAIAAKLQVFLNDPTFANLVTGKSTINLEKEINTRGRVMVFKLPSTQKLFARLMMEMIQGIVRDRVKLLEDKIVPTHIYLDEFQNYLTPTIEEVLSESRNYKLYVTFAHQSFVHLDTKMRGIVLSNSHIKVIGQCSYDDGKKMSKEMSADFEVIKNLNQGEFMFKIGSRDAFKAKNTDRFIKDNTPYHTRLSTKHMKYQFKHYYVDKDSFVESNVLAISEAKDKPNSEEF